MKSCKSKNVHKTQSLHSYVYLTYYRTPQISKYETFAWNSNVAKIFDEELFILGLSVIIYDISKYLCILHMQHNPYTDT